MFDYEDGDLLQPGELKPIQDCRTLEERNDSMGKHLAQIRALTERELTRGERDERIARMVAEMEEKQRQYERTARAEWAPAGDEGDVLARYTMPDGRIALRDHTIEIPTPDGGSVRHTQPGLLTDPYPASRRQAELQRAYTSWGLAALRARRMGARIADDKLAGPAYRTFALLARNYPGKIGEMFRGAFDKIADLATQARAGAITGGTGYGLELIPVPTLDALRRPYDLARRIPGLFQQLPAPGPSWKEPTVTGRARAKRRGVTSDPPTAFSTVRFSTSDTTISIVNLVLNALVDSLFLADGAALLGDPMGFIQSWLGAGWVDSLETAILHGDTAATHQDAIASWTLGSFYTAGDLGGSDDIVSLILGLRAWCMDQSGSAAVSSAGGSWTSVTDFTAAKVKLTGGWSQGKLYYLCGLGHLYGDLAADTGLLYQYQVGPQATMLTGSVGMYMGAEVVVSQFIASEYANTGLYTGSGSLDTALLVNPDGFVLRELAAGEEDYQALYAERGANYVGMVRRIQFYPRAVSGEIPAVDIYNI